MYRSGFSRRTFLQSSVGLTVANFVPGTTPFAHAATMEEQTIAAAKAVGKADVNGMIWSPYLVPMKPVIAELSAMWSMPVTPVVTSSEHTSCRRDPVRGKNLPEIRCKIVGSPTGTLRQRHGQQHLAQGLALGIGPQ